MSGSILQSRSWENSTMEVNKEDSQTHSSRISGKELHYKGLEHRTSFLFLKHKTSL